MTRRGKINEGDIEKRKKYLLRELASSPTIVLAGVQMYVWYTSLDHLPRVLMR